MTAAIVKKEIKEMLTFKLPKWSGDMPILKELKIMYLDLTKKNIFFLVSYSLVLN